jgi:hypothetical protein
MPVCKGCGANIVWIKTASGKSTPIDAKPERRYISIDYNWVLMDTHISHFATCPKADSFRKSKSKTEGG